MKIEKTNIKDLVLIQPNVHQDSRGYFMESFKEDWFSKNFARIKFIQDNESKSDYGVLRGLHYQKPPFAQTKLVRVIQGEILDIALELSKCKIALAISLFSFIVLSSSYSCVNLSNLNSGQ